MDLCILYVRAGVLRYGGNRKSKMGQIIQEGTIERILENKRKRGRGKENAGMSGCVLYVDEEKKLCDYKKHRNDVSEWYCASNVYIRVHVSVSCTCWSYPLKKN